MSNKDTKKLYLVTDYRIPFNELLEKTGFVKAMTSLVGQLSRSGSTQEQIVNVLREWGREGNWGQKDKEVALLYQFYRKYLKEK